MKAGTMSNEKWKQSLKKLGVLMTPMVDNTSGRAVRDNQYPQKYPNKNTDYEK